MADFNSKYSGEQVEALLDQVASGNAGGGGGGGITVETDPIFSASPAASITEEKKVEWDSKYAKPSGGIPKSDLSAEVQGALRDAIAYKGTVTQVKINGSVKSPNDGEIDLGDIPTSIPSEVYIADFTMEELRRGGYEGINVDCQVRYLIDAMNANKVILVRESTDSSYKGVYVLNGYAEDMLYFSIVDTNGETIYCDGIDYSDDYVVIPGSSLHIRSFDDKQDKLKSGTNIKTINGESILGEGDITIAGGSGEKGEKGDKGDTGVGVQSVKQTTTSNVDSGYNVVTVTLTDGTTSTFSVKNGSKGSQGIQGIQGEQGPKGDTGATGAQGPKGDKGDKGANGTNGKDGADGEDGATFTPSVDSAGNLSWTNNKGLTNPPTVNIKGPKGDAGSGGGGVSEEYVNNAIANAITNVINADY